MHINWFPGHMAKTKRLVKDALKQVDIVIELLDARIPFSSRNPEIDAITHGKQRVIVLNKSDLADETCNGLWKKKFQEGSLACIFVDSVKGKGLPELKNTLKRMMKEKIERAKAKGLLIRPIRTMVVGVPNVGKSSFINKISGKNIAATGDRPGVTRNQQWVRILDDIELLDTPGVLWPKFEDASVGICLSSTGAIKDTVFDTVEVSSQLLEILKERYADPLMKRYHLSSLALSGHDILSEIGKKRGCMIAGGAIDSYRAAAILLDEFRGGKIGRISLEWPDDRENVETPEAKEPNNDAHP